MTEEEEWKRAHTLALASEWSYTYFRFGVAPPLSWDPVNFPKCDFHRDGPTQFFVASNDNEVVISFRGTVQTVEHWTCNLSFHRLQLLCEDTPSGFYTAHSGFYTAFDTIREEVWNLMWEHGALGGQKEVWLTGHSLGGALAILLAAVFYSWRQIFSGIYTFGQPAAGDLMFAQFCNKNYGDKCFRFVNGGDPIPRLPFQGLGYQHTEKFVGLGSLATRGGSLPEVEQKPLTAQEYKLLQIEAMETERRGSTRGQLPWVRKHLMSAYIREIEKNLPKGYLESLSSSKEPAPVFAALGWDGKARRGGVETVERPVNTDVTVTPDAEITRGEASGGDRAKAESSRREDPIPEKPEDWKHPFSVHITWSPGSNVPVRSIEELDKDIQTEKLCAQTAHSLFSFLSQAPKAAPSIESGNWVPTYLGQDFKELRKQAAELRNRAAEQQKDPTAMDRSMVIILLLDSQASMASQEGSPSKFADEVTQFLLDHKPDELLPNVLVLPIFLDKSWKGRTGTNFNPIDVSDVAPAEIPIQATWRAGVEITQFMTRRHKMPRPADASATGLSHDRVTIFVNHAKADMGDTENLAQALSSFFGEIKLDSFFDAKDVDAGFPLDQQLASGQLRGMCLSLRTDLFGQSRYCQEELLRAKQMGVPVVTVYALRKGEVRSLPYGGNTPTLVYSMFPGAPPEARQKQYWAIATACLSAWLRHIHFHMVAPTLAKRHGIIDPAIRSNSPELIEFSEKWVATRAGALLFHPDPPLPLAEAEMIARHYPGLLVTTPTTMRMRHRLRTPVPIWSHWRIAFSLSDSPDLPKDVHSAWDSVQATKHGVFHAHFNQCVCYMALCLIRGGAEIGYGGHLNKPQYLNGEIVKGGFTALLSNLIGTYRKARKLENQVLFCYVANHLANGKDLQHTIQAHFINVIHPPTFKAFNDAEKEFLSLVKTQKIKAEEEKEAIDEGAPTSVLAPLQKAHTEAYEARKEKAVSLKLLEQVRDAHELTEMRKLMAYNAQEATWANEMAAAVEILNKEKSLRKAAEAAKDHRLAVEANPEGSPHDKTSAIQAEQSAHEQLEVASANAIPAEQERKRLEVERKGRSCDARIIIGGKAEPQSDSNPDGYTGRYPGQAEEALRHLQQGKPLFAVAAFGGAAGKVAECLQGNSVTVTEPLHYPKYKTFIEAYNNAADPADRMTLQEFWDKIGEYGYGFFYGPFNSHDFPDGRWINGLTKDENLQLFKSVNYEEINFLIAKGLDAVLELAKSETSAPPTPSLTYLKNAVEFRKSLTIRETNLRMVLFNGSITDAVEVEGYAVFCMTGTTLRGADGLLDHCLNGEITRQLNGSDPGQAIAIPVENGELAGDWVIVYPIDASTAPVGDQKAWLKGQIQEGVRQILRECRRRNLYSMAVVPFGANSGLSPEDSVDELFDLEERDLKDFQLQGLVLCELDPVRYQGIKNHLVKQDWSFVEDKPFRSTPFPQRSCAIWLTQEKGIKGTTTLHSHGSAAIPEFRHEIDLLALEETFHQEPIPPEFEEHDALGLQLGRKLFSGGAQKRISALNGVSLDFVHDRKLSTIPFELVRVPADHELEAILDPVKRREALRRSYPCLRNGINRCLRIEDFTPASTYHRKVGKLTMLLIVCPDPPKMKFLRFARAERDAIHKVLSTRSDVQIIELSPYVGEGRLATRENVWKSLAERSFDLIHYIGHGAFAPNDLSSSGLHLKDGLLTANELKSMMWSIPSPPAFVFLNGCEAGAVSTNRPADGHATTLGAALAEEILKAGVCGFLGNQWEVLDEEAGIFGANLYSKFCGGATLGESIRLARNELYWGECRDWANYVFYGSPGILL